MTEHDVDDGFTIDRRQGDGHVPPSVMESMVANSQNLITEAQLLRAELERIDADRGQAAIDRRRFLIIISVLLVLVVGILTLGIFNRVTSTGTRDLVTVISDCLDDGSTGDHVPGKCSQKSAKTQAKIVRSIEQQQLQDKIVVELCAREEPTEAGLRACVDRRKAAEASR